MMRKSAAVQGLAGGGVAKLYSAMQIPGWFEALISYVRAPRGVISARLAAKSEGATGA
jgi:hypothetical protein